MKRPSDATLGALLGLVGVAVFSLTLPMTRLALQSFNPVTVSLGRSVIAAFVALPVLVLTRAPRPTRARTASAPALLLQPATRARGPPSPDRGLCRPRERARAPACSGRRAARHGRPGDRALRSTQQRDDASPHVLAAESVRTQRRGAAHAGRSTGYRQRRRIAAPAGRSPSAPACAAGAPRRSGRTPGESPQGP